MPKQEGNCDIWAVVDFGEGPVKIRCTEPGEHEYHKCEVFMPMSSPYPRPVEHGNHNVFDDSIVPDGPESRRRIR